MVLDGTNSGLSIHGRSSRADRRLLRHVAISATEDSRWRICPDTGAPGAAPGPYGEGRQAAKYRILLERQPGGAFNLVNNKVKAYNLAFNLPLDCL